EMTTTSSNKILQAIFKFVDAKNERDYGTLYNCALILYGQKSDNVIKILLSFLDNDQLQQLGSFGHRLTLNENKKFDYPSFIQYLNLNFIWESLYDLYSMNVQHPNDSNLFNDIELTFTVLLKMLAQKVTDLRRLHINLRLHSSNIDEVSKGDIKNNILKRLLQPEISDLLRSTNELRQIDDATGFIRSQTHLKYLEIFNCNSGIEKLLTFSRDQELSIQTLILYHVDFYGCGPLTSLAKCENLRHLAFRYCTYIQKKMCDPLFSANFPKLNKVEAPFTSCPALEEWAKNYYK
ncbi:8697_t:CDS:2, partial [Racocetra fulgida]